GQWRSHIVSNVIGDLPEPLHESLDPVEHCIEAGCKVIELITAATLRDTTLQIATDDVAARLAHRFYATQEREAHRRTAAERQQDHDGQTPQERAYHEFLHLVQLQRTQTHEQVGPVADPDTASPQAAERI